MVWFQCEDCGENLKKPKLPNHFRICSATKLSCIDCGQVFGQESVQGHTQCITEAEKYGPKGQGKASNGTIATPNNGSKPKPDVDINVGLSERPPWFCSLCNTQATSKQTLLLHADGKKHRAKARAFHAAKQQPKQTEESPPNANGSSENDQKDELAGNKNIEEPEKQQPLKAAHVHESFDAENKSLKSSKKRKIEACENHSTRPKAGGDASGESGSGEVIQIERAETEELKCNVKKSKHNVAEDKKAGESSALEEGGKKKIKWKKLISSVLKQNPEGSLKMRKLGKIVLKSLRESGFAEDKSQLTDILEQKINSSSRFSIDGKYVRLVAKS